MQRPDPTCLKGTNTPRKIAPSPRYPGERVGVRGGNARPTPSPRYPGERVGVRGGNGKYESYFSAASNLDPVGTSNLWPGQSLVPEGRKWVAWGVSPRVGCGERHRSPGGAAGILRGDPSAPSGLRWRLGLSFQGLTPLATDFCRSAAKTCSLRSALSPMADLTGAAA
jgi:hypothetical protein